ncbi:MAG: CapA family protein [Acidobacteria bacterium]|nr:CapA family protein [Acidobacteriota bacterium]
MSPLLLAALALAPADPPIVHLVFGGDVMLGRGVYATAQRHKDPSWPFRKIGAEFSAADIAFANLESPFAAAPPYTEERMVFRAHPSMIDGLLHAGIDIVSTANNHSRDAGDPGIRLTLEILAKNKIAAVGTALQPAALAQGVILERKGIRFGFLAYTYDQRNGNHPDTDPRIAMLDPALITTQVRELRKRADVVIVSMHAGAEYQSKPNAQQATAARAAIDAGASVVVGHHPHVVQPAERYKNGVIFYSLGNLVFDQDPRPHEGAVADVYFKGETLTDWRLREVRIIHSVPVIQPAKPPAPKRASVPTTPAASGSGK